MALADRDRWNARHAAAASDCEELPNAWLAAADLPRSGEAIDLATGRGGSALWLAERGLTTTGVDISATGLAIARAQAARRGLSDRVAWIEADLDGWDPAERRWDIVACTRYLDRQLIPAIRRAVRPGGWAVVEVLSVAVDDPDRDRTGRPPRFRAEPNELLRWFSDWHVARYEEQGGTAAIVVQHPIPAAGSHRGVVLGSG